MKYLLPLFAVIILVGAGCNGTPRFTTPDEPQKETQKEAELDAETQEELEAQLNQLLGKQYEPMYTEFPGVLPEGELLNQVATIKTEKGDVVVELFGQTAPKATSNFITLSKDGFYDNLTFHRRVEGFVIQGGDPAGNGTGGPGYSFEDELKDPYSYDRGIVAMANSGPNTNGSQFFIMLADNPLPKAYTIFGRVLSGMEAVDAIVIGDKMETVEITSTHK